MNQKEAIDANAQQEEQNNKDQSTQDEKVDSNPEELKEEVDELTQLQEELTVMKDKYMRLHAEFDNFRKRNARERIDLIKNASQDLIVGLLPTLDDFDRAMLNNKDNEDIEVVKEGFGLIHTKLFNSLEQKGLKAMNSVSKKFNTDHHEAITQIPAPSRKLKGKVVDVVEKGYFLNDSVLRYAKVVVGQ